LDLFEEHGYENTTVIEIAERAGLTKSTFFRHFGDKRDVLFGGDERSGPLAQGIAAAPIEAGPLEAVAHALDAVGRIAFPPERKEFESRRRVVIAANPELQEREALKVRAQTASMSEALKRRGIPDLMARVAAKLGELALSITYRRWIELADGVEFGELGRVALAELQAASSSLVDEPLVDRW
jgi:AcrR family transcriptional regulator